MLIWAAERFSNVVRFNRADSSDVSTTIRRTAPAAARIDLDGRVKHQPVFTEIGQYPAHGIDTAGERDAVSFRTIEYVGRPGDAESRQCGREEALAPGPAGIDAPAVQPAAVIVEETARIRSGQSERMRYPAGIAAEDLRHSERGGKDADERRAMKSAFGGRLADRDADARRGFIGNRDRKHDVPDWRAANLGHGKNGGNGRRPRVNGRERMTVIEFENGGGGPVCECRS
jgi:hypothetical protein